jgi:hypothetical protein
MSTQSTPAPLSPNNARNAASPRQSAYASYDIYRSALRQADALRHHDNKGPPFRSARDFYHEDREDLWFARYSRTKKRLRWYRYWTFPDHSFGRPSTSVLTPGSSYEVVKTSHEMQRLLLEPDDDIAHQFVIIGLPVHGTPSTKILDIVGLGLDMPPPVWDCIASHA